VCKCFGVSALQVVSDLSVRNTAPFGPRMPSLLEIDPDGDWFAVDDERRGGNAVASYVRTGGAPPTVSASYCSAPSLL
jgi:hypothetical protein